MLPTERDVRRLNRPYLGASLRDGETGLGIVEVVPGSPADAAGLQAGDVLLKLGKHEIVDRRQLRTVLEEYRPGQRVRVRVLRGQEKKVTTMELGRRDH